MRSGFTRAIFPGEVRTKPLFLVLLVSIQFACVFGQRSSYTWKPDNEINFYTYPALPHKVQGFVQDNYGYLWIGSSDGLYRFDGTTFRQYINNGEDTNSTGIHSCRPFLVDSRRILWARISSGLCMLHTATNRLRTFNFSDTLFNDIITGVTEGPDHTIWISSSGRKNLTRYDASTDRFTAFEIPDSFYMKRMRTFGHAMSSDGTVYLATDNSLIRFNTRTEKYEQRFLCLLPGKSEIPCNCGIHCVMVDRFGDIYTGYWIYSGGLLVIGKLNKTRQLVEPDCSTHVSRPFATFQITEKQADELWIGTNMCGLFTFGKRTKQCIAMGHEPDNPLSFPDVPTAEVNSIFTDRNGSAWINAGNIIVKADPADQLVKRYNLRKLFGIAPGTEFEINTTFPLPGEHMLFIGTWKAAGLYQVDLKDNTVKVKKTCRDKGSTECGIQEIIRTHKGDLLALTQQHILKYDPGSGQFLPWWTAPDCFADNFAFTSIFEDSRGHFWVGTFMHGVYDFDPREHSCVHYSKKEYNPHHTGSDMIKPCFEDNDGNIWFSSFDGVFLFSVRNKAFVRISRKPDEKRYDDGRDLLRDKKGNIWRTTARGGFQKYNPKSGMFELVRADIDTRHYIMEEMTEDNRGYIWISADDEICRFDPEHLQFLFPGQSMNLEMGSHITGFCREDGTLYTSRRPMLYQTNTNLFNGNPQVPAIVFNTFKVLNRDTVFAGNLNELKTVTLPYDRNFITLEFAALNFSHSEKNQYACKLEGVDRDWVMNGNKNTASYSNLAPGKHVFHVKASNNTGLWNEEGRSLVIIITPPWWHRWWFRASMAVTAMIFMLTALKLYTTRKLRIQKNEYEKQLALDQERSRISRDLHDEVGSILSSINIIANMDERSAIPPEEKLNRIKKQTQTVLEKMSELIWMMNPANNSLENIFTQIKEYASELLEARNIEFRFHGGCDISAILIPMEQRRDLYLILKEALNNLAKYSECTRAILNVTNENNKLIIKLTDNGKGFDEALVSSGNGLVNMRKRASDLKAMILIDSELNKGTCVQLIMPIT